MTDADTTTQAADPEDERKQSKSFSLTKGLLRRIQTIMDDNNLPATEQSDLAEFLLAIGVEQVEKGTVKLPLQHIAVLKKPR